MLKKSFLNMTAPVLMIAIFTTMPVLAQGNGFVQLVSSEYFCHESELYMQANPLADYELVKKKQALKGVAKKIRSAAKAIVKSNKKLKKVKGKEKKAQYKEQRLASKRKRAAYKSVRKEMRQCGKGTIVDDNQYLNASAVLYRNMISPGKTFDELNCTVHFSSAPAFYVTCPLSEMPIAPSIATASIGRPIPVLSMESEEVSQNDTHWVVNYCSPGVDCSDVLYVMEVLAEGGFQLGFSFTAGGVIYITQGDLVLD